MDLSEFRASYAARDRVWKIIERAEAHALSSEDVEALVFVLECCEDHLAGEGDRLELAQLRLTRRAIEWGRSGTPRERMWRGLRELGWTQVPPQEKRQRMLEDLWRLTDPNQDRFPGRIEDGFLTSEEAAARQRENGGPLAANEAVELIQALYGVASYPATLQQLADAKKELAAELKQRKFRPLAEHEGMLAAPVPRRPR